MKIKRYIQFNEELFFKKKSQRMNSKEFIEWIIKNYKTLNNTEEFSSLFVSMDKNPSISYWNKNGNYHVLVEEKDGKYYLVDFNDKDGKMGQKDPETHKYKTFPTDISKEEYNRYKKSLEVIDEYLDEKDDEKKSSEQPSVGETGNFINLKEDPLEEANYLITKELEKYIDKSFTFDTDYITWDSGNSNNSSTKEIEETFLKIKEFKIDFYKSLDDDSKMEFFGEIIADWSIDNKEYKIMIDQKYKPEWIDLKKDKFSKGFYDKILKPHCTEKRTRREEKKFWKEVKYPMTQLISMTPSKYDTIEMISNFISIIEMANNSYSD